MSTQSPKSSATALRVAIIDDHQPFRQSVRALFGKSDDLAVVIEAGSGEQLLEAARTTDVDVAIMDISMPGMNGIEATKLLLARQPGVRVIGVSAYADELYVEAMLNAGAVGYFTKADADDALVQAVRTATIEQPCFGAGVSYSVASNSVANTADDGAKNEPAIGLGGREVELLRLMSRGLASAQIGRCLSMDTAMVDVYCRNMIRKLRLKDHAELTEYAMRHTSDVS